ncbi:hypothetical protein D9M73_116780 [compost metagenome]
MFPFVEPKFFGFVRHGAGIEHAVMLHDALEAIGPIALDPVHHIAAIRGPQRARIVRVEPGKLVGRGLEPGFQILQRPAAPIVADRIGEALPISGRAVEIDRDQAIARACEHRRIPAIRPAIVARPLRPAMHHERDRHLARAARGLHRIAPHRIVIGPGEAEPGDAGHFDIGQLGRVDRGQPHRALAAQAVKIVGRGQRIHRIHHPGRRRYDRRHAPRPGQPRDRAGHRRHRPDRRFLRILGGDEDRRAVGAPRDRRDRAVPAFGQRAHRAALQVAQHQHLPIGLIARPLHREPGEIFAVGRRGREIVRAVIGLGQIDRRCRSVGRRCENIEIGR